MATTKFLTEDGVRRLWAAIEAKFIDTTEIETILQDLPVGTSDMIALTNAEIDEITGYFTVNSLDDFNALLTQKNQVTVTINEALAVDSPLTIPVGKTVTVNLAENIQNNSNTAAFLVNGGNLVINGNGGTITGASAAVMVSSGSATVNGGTYTTTQAGQVLASVGANSELTLNDVKATGQEAAAMAFDGAKLTINGGDFNTIDNFVVGTNGTAGRGGNTIVINGAKLNSSITSAGYEACGVYVPNNDTVIIENTEINVEKGCGILMRAGNVTVKAGTKITTTAADAPGWVGDNKTKMSQSGIIYHEAANYPGKAGMSLVVEEGVIFNVADEEVEVISNEETPNVTRK